MFIDTFDQAGVPLRVTNNGFDFSLEPQPFSHRCQGTSDCLRISFQYITAFHFVSVGSFLKVSKHITGPFQEELCKEPPHC